MPDVADDLAGRLFALETGGLSTRAVTARITAGVLRWALAHGWSARTEARVLPLAGVREQPRLGFIDVVVRRGGDSADLAIEIDSGHKPWSVEKLRYAAAAGMRAIWIRWGDDQWAGIYDDVDVIQLRVIRNPRPRSATSQLNFWP